MSYRVYVTLSCHNWKRNDFRYSGAYFIYLFCVSHKCVLVGYSRHKKKTTFFVGMKLVSLRCNHDYTSAESYATQWYQFHTTDARRFSLNITFKIFRYEDAKSESKKSKREQYEYIYTCTLARNMFTQCFQFIVTLCFHFDAHIKTSWFMTIWRSWSTNVYWFNNGYWINWIENCIT